MSNTEKILKQNTSYSLLLEMAKSVRSAVAQTIHVQSEYKVWVDPCEAILKSNKKIPVADLIVAVPFEAEKCAKGILVFFMNKRVLKRILDGMFDPIFFELNEEIIDGLQTVASITYGVIKRDLNDGKGFQLKTSRPKLIEKDHIFLVHSFKEAMVIPFELDVGFFTVEVRIF